VRTVDLGCRLSCAELAGIPARMLDEPDRPTEFQENVRPRYNATWRRAVKKLKGSAEPVTPQGDER
jgi:hypothetical protein